MVVLTRSQQTLSDGQHNRYLWLKHFDNVNLFYFRSSTVICAQGPKAPGPPPIRIGGFIIQENNFWSVFEFSVTSICYLGEFCQALPNPLRQSLTIVTRICSDAEVFWNNKTSNNTKWISSVPVLSSPVENHSTTIIYAMWRIGLGLSGMQTCLMLMDLLSPINHSAYNKLIKMIHKAVKDGAK